MINSAFKLDRISTAQSPICSSRNSVRLSEDVSLMRGRVHEVIGPEADSFIACVIASTSGPSVWVGRGRDVQSVCPLAAQRFFDPSRIVTTECISRKEIFWASEQALRSKGADTVVIHVSQGPNLRESRRLQLAAEEGRSLGLVIIQTCAQSSAAQTRWQCNPMTATLSAANDRGWIWSLTKNKSGKLGRWQAGWKGGGHATGHVHMVSAASV